MKIIKYNQDSIMNEITRIIEVIEVKYTKLAESYETIESRRNADRYLNALYDHDSLLSYPSLDKEAITRAGITDPDEVRAILNDRYKCPEDRIDAVIREQRRIIIDTYVETNTYYRTRLGLPPIVKNPKYAQEITLTNDECDDLEEVHGTILHSLSSIKIERAEASGIIDKYRKLFPSFEYLNYLGKNKLDLAQMRLAKNFEIIKFEINNNMDNFDVKFLTTYAECREYFMEVIYNRYTGKIFAYYEEFIALMIMIMTIQRTFVNMLGMAIERDYFDLYSIEGLFNTYSIPYLSNMSLDQKRTIVKNFNKLLRHKATDVVFYDILELLGYTKVNIFELWLIKEHRLDPEGNPIFLYKEVALDENKPNEKTRVLDKDNMYRLRFKAIDKKEPNKLLHLSRTDNDRSYFEVTNNDAEWIEDEALQEYLRETEFNFVKTKYIDINVLINLSKMLYEIQILFSIICNHRKKLQDIRIHLPRIIEDRDIPIFDVIALIVEITYKLHGFKGNILYDPSKLMPVIGYNFEADFEAIKNDILTNPNIKYKELANMIPRFNVNTAEDINKLFRDIKDFDNFIVDKMTDATNYDEYEAYSRIYKLLTYCKDSRKYYEKRNGEVAKTYREFLDDIDPFYGQLIDKADNSVLNLYLDHIIYTISKIITSADNIKSLTSINLGVLTGVLELIRRFKSLTTTISDLDIVYLLDSRRWNMIYVKDKVKDMIGEALLIDDPYRYNDSATRHGLNTLKDKVKILDRFNMEALLYLMDIVHLDESLTNEGKITVMSNIIYNELHKIAQSDILMSNINHSDKIIFGAILNLITEIEVRDELHTDGFDNLIEERLALYSDALKAELSSYKQDEILDIYDKYFLEFKDRTPDSRVALKDTIHPEHVRGHVDFSDFINELESLHLIEGMYGVRLKLKLEEVNKQSVLSRVDYTLPIRDISKFDSNSRTDEIISLIEKNLYSIKDKYIDINIPREAFLDKSIKDKISLVINILDSRVKTTGNSIIVDDMYRKYSDSVEVRASNTINDRIVIRDSIKGIAKNE